MASKAAETAKARSFIKKLMDSYLECRRFGHSWHHLDAEKIGHAFIQTIECVNCTCIKTEYIDRWGDVVKTQMSYPEKYLAKGQGFAVRERKRDMRLEVLDRKGWRDSAA